MAGEVGRKQPGATSNNSAGRAHSNTRHNCPRYALAGIQISFATCGGYVIRLTQFSSPSSFALTHHNKAAPFATSGENRGVAAWPRLRELVWAKRMDAVE